MGPVARLRRLQRQLTLKVQFQQNRFHAALLLPLLAIISLCVAWGLLYSGPVHKPLYFLSVGDYGTGSVEQRAVGNQMAEAAEKHGAEFVLTVGDNFYPRGIKDLNDPLIKSNFEDIYVEKSLQIPWYITLGDHDHRESVAAQIAYSNVSKRWQLPSPYYIMNIPLSGIHTLDIIVTDSVGLEGLLVKENETRRFENDYDMTYAGLEAGRRQFEWLTEVLANSKADWRIVVGHRPLQSCADRKRFPVEERLRDLLLPLFVEYGVHVYMHGHDHVGQHLLDKGVVYVGNGVGGFGVHPARATNNTVWFRNDYMGFITHKVTPSLMEFKYKNHKGVTMHKIILKQDYSEM
ncbi:hypothetical protein R1flu_020241 [Riccia fluitans]|uniref:Calcineurin-like phosphoesterase domain-containing protein n=1 Tax=Riccia fluitans TaxID=41844 RepID=A0ABD1ZL76_9MARC